MAILRDISLIRNYRHAIMKVPHGILRSRASLQIKVIYSSSSKQVRLQQIRAASPISDDEVIYRQYDTSGSQHSSFCLPDWLLRALPSCRLHAFSLLRAVRFIALYYERRNTAAHDKYDNYRIGQQYFIILLLLAGISLTRFPRWYAYQHLTLINTTPFSPPDCTRDATP